MCLQRKMVGYLVVFMHDQVICSRKLSETPSVPVYRMSKRKPDCSKFAVTRALFYLFVFKVSLLVGTLVVKAPLPGSLSMCLKNVFVFSGLLFLSITTLELGTCQDHTHPTPNITAPHPQCNRWQTRWQGCRSTLDRRPLLGQDTVNVNRFLPKWLATFTCIQMFQFLPLFHKRQCSEGFSMSTEDK